MNVPDYVAVTVGICSVVAAFLGAIQWLVKHYLNELKPNGGGSMSDRLARVERQIEQIYDHLLK